MHVDYSNSCRVCTKSGSRNIFLKKTIDSGNPLERLEEKLRFVTMLKIEENDDLPKLLCDLCIVQLNVAYNFKRQAIENDTNLKQYFIEKGFKSNHERITNENCQETTQSNVYACSIDNTSTTSAPRGISTNFPLMPIIVKTESEEDDDSLNDDDIRFTPSTSSAFKNIHCKKFKIKNEILDNSTKKVQALNDNVKINDTKSAIKELLPLNKTRTINTRKKIAKKSTIRESPRKRKKRQCNEVNRFPMNEKSISEIVQKQIKNIQYPLRKLKVSLEKSSF